MIMVQVFGPKRVQALEGTIMSGAGHNLGPSEGGEKCSTSRRVSRWFRVTTRLNVGSGSIFYLG